MTRVFDFQHSSSLAVRYIHQCHHTPQFSKLYLANRFVSMSAIISSLLQYFQFNFSCRNKFSSVMEFYVSMLCSAVKLWILCHRNGGLVVFKDSYGVTEVSLKSRKVFAPILLLEQSLLVQCILPQLLTMLHMSVSYCSN